MEVHILNKQNSILNKFIAEIRDKEIQKDQLRFRRNIERIGEITALEISKSLTYQTKKIITPLGYKNIELPHKDVVICSILRAGLPLHQGLLNYFDDAENAFISAYRKYINKDEFEIKVEYFASPDLSDKTVILADPMLATGRSLVSVYEGLKKHGNPKKLIIACVIASTDGLQYIQSYFPKNTNLYVATVDDQLNSHGYIVPGLGDAGDLAFGNKL